jgi:hypothetical protein
MVALLAPVPEEHLVSALDVVREHKKVAFGSRSWQVFRQIDELRGDAPADVLIYASHSAVHHSLPKVSWRAKYIGHREAKGGGHPDGMTYRPPSTGKYPDDNKGHWFIFWEVRDLVCLPAELQIEIGAIFQFEKNKPYKKYFVPSGPLIIEG